MTADLGCTVNLDDIKHIRVPRVYCSAVPFADNQPGTLQVQAGKATRPDIIRGHGIRCPEIVGDVENRTDTGCDALQFEHPVAWQFSAGRDPGSCRIPGCLPAIGAGTLVQVIGKRFQPILLRY